MSFGDQKDSTMINILADPRIERPLESMVARQNMQKELEGKITLVTQAMDQLKESKETIESISKQMKDKEGDEYKALKDLSKSTKSAIDSLMDIIVGPDNSKKQGIVGSKDRSISSYLFTARRYLRSGTHNPGHTEERVVQQVDVMIKPILEGVNSFYETAWPDYRKEVEEIDLSPFKDYDPIKLN